MIDSADQGSAEAVDDPIVFEQLLRLQAAREQRRARLQRTGRQVVVLAVFICLLGLAYSAYKAVGTSIDDAQSG
ncbi:MAG: hypothetical protein OXC00_01875 [Acidimicrobiaceae bacterium]|nr:hypothetical protein [Acidimicrobiaceae bacterium]